MKCTHCGSERIVPRATVWDQGRGSLGHLKVYVEANPKAYIFTDPSYAMLYARVCADCGHTALFTDNAGELYEAYLQSQEQR